jgi:ABC-type nitrate/sulfonate/bicarbonate transport system substrate-binding protein
MKLTRRIFVAAGSAAGVVAAAPAILRAAEPMVVGYVPANAIYWDLDVAFDKGFFRAAGFDAEPSTMQSTPHSVQQAIVGAYQIAAAQPEGFVAAFERGANNLGALAAPANRADWYLVGQQDIKTITDLKGKLIGVSTLNTGEVWMTRQLLEKGGLRKGDYDFLVSGLTPQKVAALQKGSIAAAPLFQPSAELTIRLGFPALASYFAVRAYPPILYIVNKDWAAKNDAGKRVAQAIRKAHDWLWDPANKAEAVQILMKYTKREQAIVDKVYSDYFVDQKICSRTGEIELSGFDRALADMADDGQVVKNPPPPAAKYVLDRNLGGMWA